MITVYFRNEEATRLYEAAQVSYATISPTGSAATYDVLVCEDDRGQTVGIFLLSEIVGWSSEEEDEDEDDEEDEDDDEI